MARTDSGHPYLPPACPLLFNSVQFLVFLALVLGLMALVRGRRGQNVLLLGASYLFYGAWDWRFLGLILGSTLVDFVAARAIERAPSRAAGRPWLLLSLGINLGLLGFFKYADFGIASMAALLEALGFAAHLPTLGIILPVGISFYTFQTISYSIDVYRGNHRAVRSFLDFALYVAFFPQLVAGPIERATTLLPQLQSARRPTRADWHLGLTWMLLGYFHKVVLADTLAPLAAHAFAPQTAVTAPVVWLGTLAFTLQIYGDFAGYTLIARGVARLLGIRLMRNFRAPYLAVSPADFWRRWHCSLSYWFRDYVYIPLGGSRRGTWRTQANLMLTMTLSGLWHGAGWTFVLWGVYHGVGLCAQRLVRGAKPRPASARPGWVRGGFIAATFAWVCLGFLIFVAPSLGQLGTLLAAGLGEWSWTAEAAFMLPKVLLALVVIFALHFAEARRDDDTYLTRWPWWGRVAAWAFILACVVMVGFRPQPFIYFQF